MKCKQMHIWKIKISLMIITVFDLRGWNMTEKKIISESEWMKMHFLMLKARKHYL
uniref:Uncharacterized protein n=1 Tax=Anguilla anguilla TaxID=7936 RepID=A0A0E9S4V3_ANGAN